ncbi:aldehyde dehydrogenase family protein [Candidatus Microgenomates bacterium]|nr:aldehyde dehydrogenase family protein [Candidatus Microgenomates bacterium]
MAKIFEGISDQKTPPTYKFFSRGKWRDSTSGKTTDIISPVDGCVLGRLQVVTKQEADQAIEGARQGQKEWEKFPVDKRVKILHLAADWIREQEHYLSTLLVKEVGKPTSSAKSEVLRTADMIDLFAQEARTIRGETLESDLFPGFEKGQEAIVDRVALGVILAIAPFNYPLNLSASKIAPALVTGNACVFKPPTYGGISALHLVRIFEKAGVPGGVLSAVTGGGVEIGDYLATHPHINMITFTGSSKVGKAIAKQAGMIPLLFECGGNNPALVLEDANLETAALDIIKGSFSFSGQRCTAIKYVLAANEVMDQLIPKLKKFLKKEVKMGDPRDPKTKKAGPLITLDAAMKVENRIIKAKVWGAKILTGGKRKDNYVEPTILDYVKPREEIVRVETFGPILSLIRVKNSSEAIEIINSSDYGLQACIFTQDEGTGIVLAKKIEVGTVQINYSPQRGPDHFPFLGVKGSGVGVQGIGYTLEAMTRPKSVVLNKPE